VAAPHPGRPPRPRAPKPPAPPVSAETVLKSFNTWAFKREQPANLQQMLEQVSRAVARAEPVSFVLYWGKGPRCKIGPHDLECLDHLGVMAARVKEVYAPGAAIKLIFTDTHAALNGHAPHSMSRYFAEVDAAARQRGFTSCRLSQLISADDVAASDASEEAASEDMIERLSTSALKWYRGKDTARAGAVKYYQMNMIEKRAVERVFPDAIFATFNGSKFRCLFPQHLPIFYMYSLRRGVSVKPWFLPAEAAFCEDPSCECTASPT
jgi:hypothetical protein